MPGKPSLPPWKVALFSVLPGLFLLGSLEGALRAYDYVRGVNYIPGKGYTDNPNVILYQDHKYLGKTLRPKASWLGIGPDGQQVQVSINSLGFRGKEFDTLKNPQTFRIIAIGGSTTFTPNVLDSDTYPQLLENILNSQVDGSSTNFEVINAGTPGYSTEEAVINFCQRLLRLSPDLIVIYHGYNDIKPNPRKINLNCLRDGSMVSLEPSSRTNQLIHPKRKTRRKTPIQEYSRLFVKARNRLFPTKRTSPEASQRSSTVDDRSAASFRHNLNLLVDLAELNNVRVVLSTYASTLTQENIKLHPEKFEAIWFFVPHLTYEGMIANVTSHNRTIKSVAEARNLPLVLSDQLIPPTFDYFVDHVHFNRNGARLMAEGIAASILQSHFK